MKSYYKALTIRSWIKVLACICVMNALLLQGVDATCSMLVSPGDQGVGISAYSDTSCKTGGIGCFQDGACRYCKTRDTIQSQNFLVCKKVVGGTLDVGTPPAVAPTTPAPTTAKPPPATTAPLPQIPTSTCASAVSSGDQAVGIAGVADANCKNGGLGCFYGGVCRYCKARETPQASSYLPCSNFVTATAPAPAPAPASVPAGQLIAQACNRSVSLGDSLQGIEVVTDNTCFIQGGVGCVDDYCRFCKTQNTLASRHLLPCSDFPTVPATVKTPASNFCSATVSNSQALSGIWANVECLEWYKGSCLKSKCPLCKFYDTTTSAGLPACVAPPTAPIVPAALPGAPSPNLCTEAILGEAQPSVGIWAAWDRACSSSDSACVSKCRFCKYVDTVVSSPLRWCASIAPLPPAPVFAPPPAGTARPPTPAPNDCSARDVTAEKEAAGIWANAQCYEADPSGFCISVVCSPCSFYATEQSFKYPACVNGIFPYWSSTPTSPLVLVRGTAPSELSASDGASTEAGAGEHLSTFEIAVAVAAAVGVVAVFAMMIYGAKRLVERTTTEDASSILCDSSI